MLREDVRSTWERGSQELIVVVEEGNIILRYTSSFGPDSSCDQSFYFYLTPDEAETLWHLAELVLLVPAENIPGLFLRIGDKIDVHVYERNFLPHMALEHIRFGGEVEYFFSIVLDRSEIAALAAGLEKALSLVRNGEACHECSEAYRVGTEGN